MLKRIVCTFTTLAMVMVTYNPARAAYLGCMQSAVPYTLEVQTAAVVAVTIQFVSTRGKLEVEEILRFDATPTPTQSRTIPRNAVRIIFKVDASVGGNAILKINHGTNKFEVIAAPQADGVFDLSSGPFCGG